MNSFIVQCPSCGTKNKIPADKQHLTPKCGRCKRPLELNSPVRLTDQNFQEIISRAALPVLVDFFSPTCGPCRMLAPIIDRAAGRYRGRLLVAKLDTSTNRITAARYQIRGVPTLYFFKKGLPVDHIVGALSEAALFDKIENFLA